MSTGINTSRVNKIIAGTNITLSPTSGQGNVTISATGGSSSGPKLIAVNATDGTTVTSTTSVTVSQSILVPANTLATTSVLEIVWSCARLTGASGNTSGYLYINTSNTLSGATLIASSSNMGPSNGSIKCGRDLQKIGTAGKTNTTASINSDFNNTAGSINSFTINNSAPIYFLFCLTNGSLTDQTVVRSIRITEYA